MVNVSKKYISDIENVNTIIDNKIIFLDTSVLIDDFNCINYFHNSLIVISSSVIEELNNLKADKIRLRGITAQMVLKFFDKLTAEYPDDVLSGIPLENGSKLLIELNNKDLKVLNGAYDKDIEDNRILAVTKKYANDLKENKKSILSGYDSVLLLSNDIGFRVKARSVGIYTREYFTDSILKNKSEVYKGFREVFVEPDLLTDFYRNDFIYLESIKSSLDSDVFENEFIILVNEWNEKHTAVGRVSHRNGRLVVKKLVLSNDELIYGIRALDVQQLMALEILMDPEVTLVSLIGKAGTGKTLLALAAGLTQMERGSYRRLLALRTLVVVGGKEVGFLPGELEDKLKPFMAPIYDNLEYLFDNRLGKKKKVIKDKETGDTKFESINLEKILEDYAGRIVIESTGFMRGRTLPGQFIIVDEAQNLTKHEVKTLVTRVGEGGKIILMGDPDQIDDPYLDSLNNGLIYATERMKHEVVSGTVFLTGKSKRSLLAELASENL